MYTTIAYLVGKNIDKTCIIYYTHYVYLARYLVTSKLGIVNNHIILKTRIFI